MMPLYFRPRNWPAFAIALCFVASCATPTTQDFASCPAFQPAFAVTDRFMETFNARDVAAHEATLHFPHVRIASGTVTVVPRAGGDWMKRIFERLLAEGWDHSAWADRRIVQCDATKAHMLTTFVRYRAAGAEMGRFDSLYVIEFKDESWGVTARSSYAQ